VFQESTDDRSDLLRRLDSPGMLRAAAADTVLELQTGEAEPVPVLPRLIPGFEYSMRPEQPEYFHGVMRGALSPSKREIADFT
jgi:hypothetical protein